MQIVVFTVAIIISCYSVLTYGKPLGEFGDSYAISPKLDQPHESSDLELNLVPPAVNTAPHIYYMSPDGFAIPAEQPEKVLMKREAIPSIAAGDHPEDDMLAAETIIIGPPSGRPFGTPALSLGYRSGHAYYARRYHKYPWNYH